MKVQRFWNEWYDHRWLMIIVFVYCMQIQKQHWAWAAALDSEILSEIRSGNSIEKHAWPPMKNHDIWNDGFAYANVEYLDDDDVDEVDKVGKVEEVSNIFGQDDIEFVGNSFDSSATMNSDFGSNRTWDETEETKRKGKVLHIFPVPVDGECLSNDGRRIGNCLNAYECRQKGGTSKGECAMGFGVCCIFIANCNETVSNNITYLVSPQFPSFMPSNFSSCSIKVKLMSDDISQLRFDFNHFSIGQPNRRTGICDGDVFSISGGLAGSFSLCGQNSGQHLYYDVGGRALPRQSLYGNLRPPTLAQLYPNRNSSSPANQLVEISMNFAQRFAPIRLWEIRISQIPFSQRAPAGCLQYHVGTEGVIQTFNFADNGRHLANQHYRVCMRQETEMCSIMYQPCDEQSFRIGPSMPFRGLMQQSQSGAGTLGNGGTGGAIGPGGAGGTGGVPVNSGGIGSTGGTPGSVGNMGVMGGGINPLMMGVMPASVAADDPMASVGTTPLTQMLGGMSTASSVQPMRTTLASSSESTTNSAPASSSRGSTMPPTMSSTTSRATRASTTTAAASSTTTAPSTTPRTTSISTTTQASTTLRATSPLSDEIEGSGDGGSFVTPATSIVNRRPRPVRGGFDFLGFLRSAFDIGLGQRQLEDSKWQLQQPQRQQRQIYSTCSDRITLPCIIEDFIGAGLGPVPSCEPVHCGTQFCSSGNWPCQIESTVTPFFLNIHFGNGAGKGSAEDNIGACLRYTQMRCM